MTEEGGKKNWLPLESNPDVMNAVRLWGGRARAPRGLQWELVGVPSSGMSGLSSWSNVPVKEREGVGALAPSSPLRNTLCCPWPCFVAHSSGVHAAQTLLSGGGSVDD